MVHTFGRGVDGTGPEGLTPIASSYFTGFVGTATASANASVGRGNVFAIKPGATAQAETILYDFKPAPDVNTPQSPPTLGTAAIAKTLFGMADRGGTHNQGGVYRIVPSGARGAIESVLYNFGDNRNDPVPGNTSGGLESMLVQADASGKLVGTTENGGAFGTGAFFELTPPRKAGDPWTEKVKVSFDANQPNGGGHPEGTPLRYFDSYYGALVDDISRHGAVYELNP